MTPYVAFSLETESAVRGTGVVAVRGEIDMASAPDFEEALGRALRDHGRRALIVDLTAVTFIDSSGLSALVRAVERQRWADAALAVVASDSRVSTLFEISHLDEALPLFHSRDDAVAALVGPGYPRSRVRNVAE